MNNTLRPFMARITFIRKETHDTSTYRLQFKGSSAFSFLPGQFNMVGIPGLGEAPISFSSNPGEKDEFEHTIRAVGRVTQTIAHRKEGDRLQIRGPYGRGWPIGEARGKNILVVAGGIGMAPLRGFLLHIWKNRHDFGKVVILYGARTPEDLLFREELPRWQKKPNTQLLLTVDQIPPRTQWEENQGVVTTLFDRVKLSPDNTLALICGPEIMMRFVAVGFLQRGYPSSRLYLSLERRMRCGIGQCGHCQIGPKYVCRDGPVFSYREIRGLPDTLM
ncbi:MAG: FAD/NAD(P)-binding protein [bacterium]